MPPVMRAALAQWGGRHGIRILAIAFFIPAALLFAPILYYSLDTPFGLVDDYADWKYSLIFTSPALFLDWLDFTFVGADVLRYRPFWDFYNATAWSVFGTTPWLHHLSRWVFHFVAILMFALAFLRFARPNGEDGGGRTWMLPLIPVAFLVYLWMFFPNSPASRLSPQEVYTVFFLGMCTLAVAATLKGGERKGWLISGGRKYSLFLIGYTGLVLSKEVNFAVAFWLLLAYVIHASLRSRSRRSIAGSIPLVLLFAFTCSRVYTSLENYDPSASFGSFTNHAETIAKDMFQVETSLIITAVFSLFICMGIVISFMNRTRSDDFLFHLFLIGQVFSFFFILTFSSRDITLRYWYPAIPGFMMIMAFAVKYLVLRLRNASPLHSRTGTALIIAFVAFFLMINYYNYSNQTIAQHSARKVDESTLAAIARLHASGQYVHNYPRAEQDLTLFYYFEQYQPFFRGLEIENVSWLGWPLVIDISFSSPDDSIHSGPPLFPDIPYFTVHRREESVFDLLTVREIISSDVDYGIISRARTLARFLQRGTPHVSVDGGSPSIDGSGSIEYEWAISRVPFGDVTDRVFDVLQTTYDRATPEDPIAHSIFKLYTVDDRLIYVREECDAADTDAGFFLHVVPVDTNALLGERQRHGFDNLDFFFAARGARFDGRCVAIVPLPDYAVASISTGQYGGGEGEGWGVEFVPGASAGALRTAYERVAGSAPVARSTFDIHFIENQLVYVREQCAAEDTDDWFFLHLTPVDTGDLPDARREYGFDSLDFRFALRGSRFDGRCVASVPLPDYPIAGIRTGQYGDGGETWSVEFAPER